MNKYLEKTAEVSEISKRDAALASMGFRDTGERKDVLYPDLRIPGALLGAGATAISVRQGIKRWGKPSGWRDFRDIGVEAAENIGKGVVGGYIASKALEYKPTRVLISHPVLERIPSED